MADRPTIKMNNVRAAYTHSSMYGEQGVKIAGDYDIEMDNVDMSNFRSAFDIRDGKSSDVEEIPEKILSDLKRQLERLKSTSGEKSDEKDLMQAAETSGLKRWAENNGIPLAELLINVGKLIFGVP